MKKAVKCGMLLALCLTAVGMLTGMKSEAAPKKPACLEKQTVYYAKSEDEKGKIQKSMTKFGGTIFIKNMEDGAKITRFRSSNKKYMAGEVPGVYNAVGVFAKAGECKAGDKTTISFVVKQGKKSYKLSCAVTVKEWKSDFTALKIGNKNYASAVKGYNQKYVELAKRSGKQKISVKAKKNVKVTDIEIYYKGKRKPVKVKNGSKVSLKNAVYMRVDYDYKKMPKNYKKSFDVTKKNTGSGAFKQSSLIVYFK